MIKFDQVLWAEFKAFVNSRGVSIQFRETSELYIMKAWDGWFGLECDLIKAENADEVTDFETNYKEKSNKSPNLNVTTQYEKEDKVLKLCSATGTVDENGDCTLLVKVPGDFNPDAPSRYIAGGYAVTNVYGWGDRCTNAEIVDVDNILGYGAGTVLESYHDEEVDEVNRGWRFYGSPCGEGEIEVEPVGGFGKLPGGLYLRCIFKIASGNPCTKIQINIWWGKSV